jgi:hypothetical protein
MSFSSADDPRSPSPRSAQTLVMEPGWMSFPISSYVPKNTCSDGDRSGGDSDKGSGSSTGSGSGGASGSGGSAGASRSSADDKGSSGSLSPENEYKPKNMCTEG